MNIRPENSCVWNLGNPRRCIEHHPELKGINNTKELVHHRGGEKVFDKCSAYFYLYLFCLVFSLLLFVYFDKLHEVRSVPVVFVLLWLEFFCLTVEFSVSFSETVTVVLVELTCGHADTAS